VASARRKSSSEIDRSSLIASVRKGAAAHFLHSILLSTKRVMKSGTILIPQIEILPTAVVANGDKPPELEIRFDMPYGPDFVDVKSELPPNWQLRFIHNQLFKHFYNPSRFCPGAFHSTIVRKAEFRSEKVC
jgi:hypothetical protein